MFSNASNIYNKLFPEIVFKVTDNNGKYNKFNRITSKHCSHSIGYKAETVCQIAGSSWNIYLCNLTIAECKQL
jgi:hypothetical protein